MFLNGFAYLLLLDCCIVYIAHGTTYAQYLRFHSEAHIFFALFTVYLINDVSFINGTIT